MYIARLRMNPNRRETARLLRSRQILHASIMAAFPPGEWGKSGPGRVLWRLERKKLDPTVLVVSGERPDLRHIEEKCCWLNDEFNSVKDYVPFLDRLKDGQKVVMRLTVDPVRSVRDSTSSANTTHRPCVTESQQMIWIEDRLEKIGLNKDKSDIIVSGVEKTSVSKKGRERPLSIVTYDGVGEISDADKLRSSLLSGIGKSRAVGAGLLTVAPSAQ